MIAIGLLADEADRTQLRTIRWNPMATAQESRSYATQTRLRRGFPISPLVCGEISSNRPWYRSYQDAGTTDLAEAGDTRARSYLWGMLTAQRTIRRGGVQMTRLERGFYDGNGEFVTADERVECRLGGRGTVNAIFQGGEAEVMFDDDADLSLVKWDHIWKLPSWAQKT